MIKRILTGGLALLLIKNVFCYEVIQLNNIYTKKEEIVWTLDQTAQNNLEGHIQVNSIKIEDSGIKFRDKFFKNIILDNKNIPVEKSFGNAELPFFSALIVGEKKNFKVNYQLGKEHTVEGLFITPSPKTPCRCDDLVRNRKHQFIVSNKYFENKRQSIFEFEDLGKLRGIAITRLVVRPFIQTNIGLKIYKNLNFEIQGRNRIQIFNDIEVKNLTSENEFVFVYDKSFESGVNAWRIYKELQGYNVTSVIFDKATMNVQDLKTQLNQLYKENQFKYALLFGNMSFIPSYFKETSNSLNTPSDYPYFLMDGEDDILPDVFYGRIVAENTDDVLRQLDKVKEYDGRTWIDDSGLKSDIGIASNEGISPTDIEYLHQMLDPLSSSFGHDLEIFYQDDKRSRPQQITNSFNEGSRWVNYIGHGSGVSWSSINRGEYHFSEIAKFNSDVVKPIIVDVSCQNGRFEEGHFFGERMMNSSVNNSPVGAVAYYGGSVDISWDPPAVMAVEISKELAKGNPQSLFSILLKGQINLIKNFYDIEAAKENLIWYHLLGDPSLLVDFP